MLKNAVCSQIPRLSRAGLALSTIKPLQSSANINSCHSACTGLSTSTELAACRDLGTPAGPVLPCDLTGVSADPPADGHSLPREAHNSPMLTALAAEGSKAECKS